MIHRGLPFEQYRAMPGENFSRLSRLAKSPAHYDVPQEDTDAMKLGRAVHVALLEPSEFEKRYVSFLGRRSGKAWDQFEAEALAGGRDVLTGPEAAAALSMALEIRSDPAMAGYLEGETEVSVQATVAGVLVKARFDLVCANGALVDLKKAKDASREGFGRSALNYRLHAQGALYHDVWLAETGEDRPFAFLAVEATKPYCHALYVMPDDALRAGRELYLGWLETVQRCRASNKWPGYAPVEFLQMPRWTGISDEGLETEEA